MDFEYNVYSTLKYVVMSKCEVVSESLILTSSKPGVQKEHYKKFCLRLPDWCLCCAGEELNMAENSNPNGGVKNSEGRSSSGKSLQLKRTRATTKTVLPADQKKVKNNDDRFSFDITIEELDAFKEGDCPSNTIKNTEVAVRTFESWRIARNKSHPLDLCPQDLFETKDHQEICDWLCKFVMET